jgi:hypothetical protein
MKNAIDSDTMEAMYDIIFDVLTKSQDSLIDEELKTVFSEKIDEVKRDLGIF